MSTSRICSIEGCEGKHLARGWCVTHYRRWRDHGDPNGGIAYGEAERFYQRHVLTHTGADCLFWPFARGRRGRYGHMRHNGAVVLVHRRVCMEVNGPPPSPRHEAAHSCGNGHLACVAPGHLSWKTHMENMADTLRHGTHNRGARNCHVKLTEDQVRVIRKLRGTAPMSTIGRRFGVSGASIHQIYTGKAWAWVA